MKPGYKLTELGVIPEDWEVRSLESLGKRGRPAIKAGPFGSSLTKASYVAEGYKIYGQEQVIRGDYRYGDYFISKSRYDELKSCAVQAGDILLSLVGTAGRVLVVPPDAPEGIINPRLMRFSFDPDVVYPIFFKEVFESDPYQSLLNRNAQGGTMGVLNAGLLKPLLIPIPPLPEQRAIAAALSDTDALFSSLDRLLAKKRDIKQAVMQKLLTGKQRLPGFSGEWESEQLGKLVRISKGQQLNRAELSASTGFPAWNGGVEPSGYTDTWNTAENTITISEGGNSCGFVGYVNQKFWCGGHCYALLDVRANLDKSFLYYLLKSKQQLIMGLRMGSGLPNIQRKYLSELLLLYPTLSEQTAIAAVLSDMDAEIDALQQRRDKTRAIKQGMMQELLTGRTRLV